MKRYKNVSSVVMNIGGHTMGPGKIQELEPDTAGLEMLVHNGYLSSLDSPDIVPIPALQGADLAEEVAKAEAAQKEAEAAARRAAENQNRGTNQEDESKDDADRREFLMAEIERLTGKAADKRLGIDKLEALYTEAANAAE